MFKWMDSLFLFFFVGGVCVCHIDEYVSMQVKFSFTAHEYFKT